MDIENIHYSALKRPASLKRNGKLIVKSDYLIKLKNFNLLAPNMSF